MDVSSADAAGPHPEIAEGGLEVAEGSGGVSVTPARGPRAPREIEGAIRRRRGEIRALAAELNRRPRELTNPSVFMRRHALGVTVALLLGGAVAGGSIAHTAIRARRA